jgi:protoporphyrinogen oxidase
LKHGVEPLRPRKKQQKSKSWRPDEPYAERLVQFLHTRPDLEASITEKADHIHNSLMKATQEVCDGNDETEIAAESVPFMT